MQLYNIIMKCARYYIMQALVTTSVCVYAMLNAVHSMHGTNSSV